MRAGRRPHGKAVKRERLDFPADHPRWTGSRRQNL
jgi:hypothetical protein